MRVSSIHCARHALPVPPLYARWLHAQGRIGIRVLDCREPRRFQSGAALTAVVTVGVAFTLPAALGSQVLPLWNDSGADGGWLDRHAA